MTTQEHFERWIESHRIFGNKELVERSVTEEIAKYFLFKNIEATSYNIAVIRQAILDFSERYKTFTLYDLELAIKTQRINDEMNISAAHVIGLLNKYLRSDLSREIFAMYQDWKGNKLPETTQQNQEQGTLFEKCFAHWKLTGEIRLNSGAVYVETFKAMKEALGMDELERIAKEEKDRTLQKLEALRATLTKMAEHHELQSQIDEVEKNGPLLKNAIRRAHLKAYFEMMEKQLA